MAAIVGREAELRQLEAAIDRVPQGGPAGILIEGPAGIGKSTIWEAGVAAATDRGWLVLTARPAASESQLTLGVLADLLAPVDDIVLDRLPPPQRRALAAALLRADEDPARPALEGRVLGTAVRNLLEILAAARPVLVGVDDVQWADAASSAALAYSLRRLAGQPVAVLLARRTPLPTHLDPDEAIPGDHWIRIAVGPLALGSVNEVLRQRGPGAPSRATLVRIHEASGGNPLFALEIARALAAHGETPAGEALPIPADIRELLRERLSTMPQGTREVLLDLAVVGAADLARLAAMRGRDVATDLDRAVADGLVRRDNGLASFAHPLYAAAAEAGASPADRRAAHARAAETATSLEAEARHRALAIDGPDAGVAAALEAAAGAARGRAAPLSAAELLRLAVERTPGSDASDRDRRRLALGDELKRAGDATAAVRELETVATGPFPHARARARLSLAAIRFETDASPGAAVDLARLALADAAGDPALEAHAYAVLASVDWEDLRRQVGYVRAAQARVAAGAAIDPVVEALILTVRCGDDVRSGRPLDPAMIERALELERLAPAPAVSDRFSAALGTWLKSLDRFDEARHWVELTRQTAMDEGDEGSLPYALAHLPELEVWTGHWDRAEAAATEHLAVAEAAGLESQRDQALYNLALVHAHQGREDAARAEIDAGIAAAAASGDDWIRSGILPLLGFLELSLGRVDEAIAPLEEGYALRTAIGGDAPMRAQPDLVEALVGARRLARADEVLADMEDRARRFNRHSALALAARSRALVLAARGSLETARAALDEALEHHAIALIPFERARTLLVLGQVRRRLRERGAARDAFEEAHSTFDGLGARLWTERAAAELSRTGIRRGAGLDLTETERRVAELAAAGMTNREVAAALFMSPKTVDANLGRAYAKLGIRSRAELGAVIARRDQAGPAQT